METLQLLAPVARVVLVEDRAQVERQGGIDLPGGVVRLSVEGISPLAVDRSVACTVEGARLLDVRLVRRWRPRPAGEGTRPEPVATAAELTRLDEELAVERRDADDAVVRAEARSGLVEVARADLLRAIADESGGGGVRDESRWSAELARVEEAAQKARAGHRAAVGRVRQLEQRRVELVQARRQVAQPEQALSCSLEVTVEGSGRATVRPRYLVPCAAWRPAYRAHVDGALLRLESEAVLWQRTEERWDEVEVVLSTARPTLGVDPPRLTEDRVRSRPRAAEEKMAVHVEVREQEIQQGGEGGSSAELPGLDDGGEVRTLRVPGRVTVSPDGQPHRFALGAFSAPVSLCALAHPERAPHVVLVGRLRNESPQVLLAGPVDLVRDGGYVGRAELRYTAPGEQLRLSLGAVDALRVQRAVETTREESRLTGRRTTRTTVRLFVSNLGESPEPLVIEERLPVSEVKEVEVRLLGKECAPAAPTLSAEGIARFELALPPRSRSEVRLVWELEAAAKVSGL